jgi:uncharacterized membrane protein YgcG
MRPAMLLPVALIALIAGACTHASDRGEQTAFQVPKRDLTLQPTDAPGLDVASSVELKQPPVHQASHHEVRRTRRPTAAPARAVGTVRPIATAAPAPASQPAAKVAAAAPAEPPDPYALAPGQTITVLPVSNAGSSDAAPGIESRAPADGLGGASVHGGGGGHGGSCGGRGGRHGGGGGGLR